MKIKRLRMNRIIILILALIIIIGGSVGIVNNIKYKKSYEYKLIKKGYNETEIDKIQNTFKEEEIDIILELEYNKALISFINKKYFILENVGDYLKYNNKNKSFAVDKVIALVNTGVYKGWYENIKETKINKAELMIVNKLNSLNEDYEPEDLVLVSSRYAYDGKYISESIYNALTEMLDAAKEEGFTLVITQGYRSYDDQKEAYDSYRAYHTLEESDRYAARAGHSEYQTGLSLLIEPYNKIVEDVTTSLENEWLLNNVHEYGFILRYPEDKEDITGFNYEPWRFRYVGETVAKYIYENDITFDEYYAYFES